MITGIGMIYVDDSRENLELAHGDRDYRPPQDHSHTDAVINQHGWVFKEGRWEYEP